jgi:hypothetical protein
MTGMPSSLSRRLPMVTAFCALAISLHAQTTVTSPRQQFGFPIGDDYQLVNYTQLVSYWQKLARQSNRLVLDTIGTSAEGRPILMMIVTAPENHRRLAFYKDVSRRLARAEIPDSVARKLVRDGKAVVWIDGGLHATEVLGAQQLIETVYQMASRSDPETMRILRDVIMLAVLVNPDGMELVSNWYMRDSVPEKRSLSGLPRLYQKYVGHDNNRDFYLGSQPETQAINRVTYQEWYPQIIYNHHQTGPDGTVLFAPPFRDPFNYNLDPLIPLSIDLIGANMHSRFVAEGKPGSTMRSGSSYSTWWNGGLRTTVYFHNMIGLLTESIGSPTPIDIPFVPDFQLPRADIPAPIAPQKWHFRQSIDYSVTANRSVLDLASRQREHFLTNIYRMGRNSIERGSHDNWTITPKRIDLVRARVSRDSADSAGRRSTGTDEDGVVATRYFDILRDPAARDPRAYIIPADQPDFLTATKFVNALIDNGIVVHRAATAFSTAGRNYPAGSYVVQTAQAFRPHIRDMFEPQDHPNDIPYPGAPPTRPYDNAGYTLAYQMGVRFDRILDSVSGPLERIAGRASFPVPAVSASPATGYLIDHRTNDSFRAVNRLIAAGEEVYWLDRAAASNPQLGPGAFYVRAGERTRAQLEHIAHDIGVSAIATTDAMPDAARRMKPVRIGLWDQYGGSMPSGWVRWILEQFEFPYEVVYAPTLDAGSLRSKYDVLVFVTGAIPRSDSARRRGWFDNDPGAMNRIPAEYRARIGNVTVAKTVPQIRRFLEEGGTVLTVGSSTVLATHLGLPITNALVEKTATGERPLPAEKFYVPGSVLRARVDSTQPVAHGIPGEVDVFYDNSPLFRLGPGAEAAGVKRVAWFDNDSPLRSGWAWGSAYLNQGVAVLSAPVGKGTLYMFGPEITFRAQPHGTFKFLFNGLYLAGLQ